MSWFSENIVDLHKDDIKHAPGKLESKSIPKSTTSVADVQYVDSSGPSNPPIAGVGDYKQNFDDLLKAANLPGPDYYEFVVAKNKLLSLPVEAMRYTAAFSVLEATGITKDVILSSAEKYKAVIDKEVANFDGAYQAMVKSQVTDLRDQVKAKQDKMADLAKQIDQLNQESTKLAADANTAEYNLGAKAAGFHNGAIAAKTDIDTEVNKINQYIN